MVYSLVKPAPRRWSQPCFFSFGVSETPLPDPVKGRQHGVMRVDRLVSACKRLLLKCPRGCQILYIPLPGYSPSSMSDHLPRFRAVGGAPIYCSLNLEIGFVQTH